MTDRTISEAADSGVSLTDRLRDEAASWHGTAGHYLSDLLLEAVDANAELWTLVNQERDEKGRVQVDLRRAEAARDLALSEKRCDFGHITLQRTGYAPGNGEWTCDRCAVRSEGPRCDHCGILRPKDGTMPPEQVDLDALAEAIRAELHPIHHVTPGGLKFSRSEDALRKLSSIARGGTDSGEAHTDGAQEALVLSPIILREIVRLIDEGKSETARETALEFVRALTTDDSAASSPESSPDVG